MQGRNELLINNEEEMVFLGQLLAEACGTRGTIYLHGNLGAGKTTFCRGVLQGLGHSGAVKSPTYTLVEPYQLKGMNVYHFDLYRLADPEELEFIGARDYFEENSLYLVEWPCRGEGLLPQADMKITLDYKLPGRIARLEGMTDYGRQRVDSIVAGFFREVPPEKEKTAVEQQKELAQPEPAKVGESKHCLRRKGG